MKDFHIRPARTADCGTLVDLIRELAEYERLSHEVMITPRLLAANLFGSKPVAEALLGEHAGEPVGYALFFGTYSTFTGEPGIYLEDLFIRPGFRGRGFGRAMLSHVAAIAVARGCSRFEWSVLDWNQPALDFYATLGATPLADWTRQRLAGEALRRLAGAGKSGPAPDHHQG